VELHVSDYTGDGSAWAWRVGFETMPKGEEESKELPGHHIEWRAIFIRQLTPGFNL